MLKFESNIFQCFSVYFLLYLFNNNILSQHLSSAGVSESSQPSGELWEAQQSDTLPFPTTPDESSSSVSWSSTVPNLPNIPFTGSRKFFHEHPGNYPIHF